jgi:hypothetical protein
VVGKNENAHGFPFSANSSIFLEHAVAYVNQLKMPVAREGLILLLLLIIIIIIIQKRHGGGSETVRGR